MTKKNVHSSTRTQYSRKQQKIVTWALKQPGLKDYVVDGILQKGGLTKMATHAKWFIAFLTSLSFDETHTEIPLVTDDADILLAKGISTMHGYKSALHKASKRTKSPKAKTTLKKSKYTLMLLDGTMHRRCRRTACLPVHILRYEVHMQYLSVPIESGALGHKIGFL